MLVVGCLWATTRRRPTNLTLAGVALAVAGIMLVLDVFAGAHINAAGVGVGTRRRRVRGVLLHDVRRSERRRRRRKPELDHARRRRTDRRRAGDRHCSASSGVMPLTFTTNDTVIAGLTMSWVVPVIALA